MEIWNKQSGFNLADGTSCTVEEIYSRYPFTRSGTIVIEKLPNGNVGAIDSLDVLKQVYGVDNTLSDTDALTAIETAKNTPPAPIVDPVEAKLDYLIMCQE